MTYVTILVWRPVSLRAEEDDPLGAVLILQLLHDPVEDGGDGRSHLLFANHNRAHAASSSHVSHSRLRIGSETSVVSKASLYKML